MTRRIRLVAWSVIAAFAMFGAYAQRFAVGPDGISYLDLSDGVVTGRLSLLVSTYWSPLYPFLVGIARLLTGAGPASEVPAMHVVNVVAFVGMSAAFEYMLISILAVAAGVRHSLLSGGWGLAGAYALYAVFALTMIPQELTTPDVLCATMVFVAFGALLRLHSGSHHDNRDAVVLGAALGLGALAKSFMVPWAIVCLVVLALAKGRRGARTVLVAAAAWALFVVPWTLVLSHTAGRFTVGDTGRLTYAWYVNEQNPPSRGGVPVGARTPKTDSILPGVGATGNAPGTDPMWFDPSRWNAGVSPHWSLPDQLETLRVFGLFYIQNFTPLLFLIVLIAAAPRGTRADVWWKGWIVYIPALAGVMGYGLVLVTARYVMPFVLAGTLTILATLPRARRGLPLLVAAGLVAPLAMEGFSATTILGLALVASVIGGVMVGVLVPHRSKALWVLAVVVGLGVTRALLTPKDPLLLRVGSLAMVLVIGIAARAAIRDWRSVSYTRRLEAAIGVTLALLLGLRLGLRLKQDVQELHQSASPTFSDPSLLIARDLERHGVASGTSIAVIGPHAESYWARTGRLHIVANVPRTLTADFWRLSPAARDTLLARFAAAGASVAVASVGPEEGAPDSSWTPVGFRGWIRKLKY